MSHDPLPISTCLPEADTGTKPSFDAIREGNIRTGLEFFQTGQPFIPCYVANGWLYSYRYVAEHARVTAL